MTAAAIRHRIFTLSRALNHGACVVAASLLLTVSACSSVQPPQKAASAPAPAPPAAPPALIPYPASISACSGSFVADARTSIEATTKDPEANRIAHWLGAIVERTRGIHFATAPAPAGGGNTIAFELDPARSDTDEGYALDVSSTRIVVKARSAHGLFNGAATLWQLLTLDAAQPARVPCLHIEDHPRFAWRGLMLDPARHFQSPEFVKHFIDWMSVHKLNVLHWHLTDDQGWRIEIKKYPKLTQVGAWRQPAGAAGLDEDGKPFRYGGFYTQDEIRDIVAYAQQRFVTIVPEIEMPGHAQAAIAAYPRLGVTGSNPGVSRDWGVHTYLYNVDDSTFHFFEDVLGEVMGLFPSPYIHIGGDEAAKEQWHASAHVQAQMRKLGVKDETGLQAYFTKRIEKFLSAHGRKLIGWDEILEGGIPEQATVMSWRGTKGAVEAAKLGHDVVLSPDPSLYFDHLPGDLPDEPAGRPKVISVQDVYDFEVVPKEIDVVQAAHVLGAQAPLWSEYFRTEASVARAAFPRAAALAEVLWSPASTHDWNSFIARLAVQQARYRALGMPYAQSVFAVRIDADLSVKRDSARVTLANQTHYGTIRYTLDGGAPTAHSSAYSAPFDTPASGEIRAAAFTNDTALADARARKLDRTSLLTRNSAELAQCNPASGVILKLPVDGPSNTTRDAVVVDIFDPCWAWPKANLDGIDHLEIDTALLPYNFQLYKDAKNIVTRKPATYPIGELQLHVDRCDGPAAKTVSLAPLLARNAGHTLAIPVADIGGTHDFCLRFATGKHDPMWVVRSAQLVPKS